MHLVGLTKFLCLFLAMIRMCRLCPCAVREGNVFGVSSPDLIVEDRPECLLGRTGVALWTGQDEHQGFRWETFNINILTKPRVITSKCISQTRSSASVRLSGYVTTSSISALVPRLHTLKICTVPLWLHSSASPRGSCSIRTYCRIKSV